MKTAGQTKAGKAFLLIARAEGSSSSRRQRGFNTRELAETAIQRWEKEGFTVFWMYDESRTVIYHGTGLESRKRIEKLTAGEWVWLADKASKDQPAIVRDLIADAMRTFGTDEFVPYADQARRRTSCKVVRRCLTEAIINA